MPTVHCYESCVPGGIVQHTLAPPPRLEFVGQPAGSAGAAPEALRPGCALEVQDMSLTLPPSGSAGRLSRDTSTTLTGGLQRPRDPGMRLGPGPGAGARAPDGPARPAASWA
jgi:hypothetical protein